MFFIMETTTGGGRRGKKGKGKGKERKGNDQHDTPAAAEANKDSQTRDARFAKGKNLTRIA